MRGCRGQRASTSPKAFAFIHEAPHYSPLPTRTSIPPWSIVQPAKSRATAACDACRCVGTRRVLCCAKIVEPCGCDHAMLPSAALLLPFVAVVSVQPVRLLEDSASVQSAPPICAARLPASIVLFSETLLCQFATAPPHCVSAWLAWSCPPTRLTLFSLFEFHAYSAPPARSATFRSNVALISSAAPRSMKMAPPVPLAHVQPLWPPRLDRGEATADAEEEEEEEAFPTMHRAWFSTKRVLREVSDAYRKRYSAPACPATPPTNSHSSVSTFPRMLSTAPPLWPPVLPGAAPGGSEQVEFRKRLRFSTRCPPML